MLANTGWYSPGRNRPRRIRAYLKSTKQDPTNRPPGQGQSRAWIGQTRWRGMPSTPHCCVKETSPDHLRGRVDGKPAYTITSMKYCQTCQGEKIMERILVLPKYGLFKTKSDAERMRNELIRQRRVASQLLPGSFGHLPARTNRVDCGRTCNTLAGDP